MLQYVRISYATSRAVFVDGAHNGMTNEIIRVGEGSHKFDLGVPDDYSPEFIESQVSGTTSIRPLQLQFNEIPAEESP